MSRTLKDVTVEKSALGAMTKLDSGGQGTIYSMQSAPPIAGAEGSYVYKQYHSKILKVSGHSLTSTMPQLVLYPDGFSDEDQKTIRRNTVWPQALVVEGGVARGILMKRIPAPFYFDLQLSGTGSVSSRLLNGSYLMLPEAKKQERGIPAASLKERLSLVLDVLKIVDFLHDRDLVIGDFSSGNLVLSNPEKSRSGGPTRRFIPKFLDVDAFRFSGGVPPIAQLHTPTWFPPEIRAAAVLRDKLIADGAPQAQIARARASAGVQNAKSDIFKMGLLALRLMHVPDDPNEDDTQSVYRSASAEANLERLAGSRRAKRILSMLENDPAKRPTAYDVLAEFASK